MPSKPKYNLLGRRFGKQRVVARHYGGYGTLWVVRCDCGVTRPVCSYDLRLGHSTQCKSCAARQQPGHIAGVTRCRMLQAAKKTARRLHLPFNLTLADTVIPRICPLLAIPLRPSTVHGKPTPNSPSLDRIIPQLGYVKGNVQVISFKANTIKSNATLKELTMLVRQLARVQRGT